MPTIGPATCRARAVLLLLACGAAALGVRRISRQPHTTRPPAEVLLFPGPDDPRRDPARRRGDDPAGASAGAT